MFSLVLPFLVLIVLNLLFFRLHHYYRVACESGAWLRRFDDVTGVVKTDIFR